MSLSNNSNLTGTSGADDGAQVGVAYEFAYAGLPPIPAPSLAIRLTMGFILLIQSLLVVLFYSLIIIALKRNWKQLNKNGASWYTLVAHLAVGDLSLVVVIIVVSVPVCFAAYPFYGPLVTEILAQLDTFGFHGMFLCVICMCLSRFFFFTWKPAYEFMFSPERLKKTLGVVWFLTVFAVFMYNVIRCRKWFHPTGFFFNYFCAPGATWPVTYVTTVARVELATPILIFLLYVTLFVYLWLKSLRSVIPTDQQQQARQNKRMMIQSFIICGVLVLQLGTFWLFPTYVGGYLASYATNTATILNSAINPIIYMMFNPLLRGKVKDVLGIKRAVAETTAAQGTNGAQGTNPGAGAGAGAAGEAIHFNGNAKAT